MTVRLPVIYNGELFISSRIKQHTYKLFNKDIQLFFKITKFQKSIDFSAVMLYYSVYTSNR